MEKLAESAPSHTGGSWCSEFQRAKPDAPSGSGALDINHSRARGACAMALLRVTAQSRGGVSPKRGSGWSGSMMRLSVSPPRHCCRFYSLEPWVCEQGLDTGSHATDVCPRKINLGGYTPGLIGWPPLVRGARSIRQSSSIQESWSHCGGDRQVPGSGAAGESRPLRRRPWPCGARTPPAAAGSRGSIAIAAKCSRQKDPARPVPGTMHERMLQSRVSLEVTRQERGDALPERQHGLTQPVRRRCVGHVFQERTRRSPQAGPAAGERMKRLYRTAIFFAGPRRRGRASKHRRMSE